LIWTEKNFEGVHKLIRIVIVDGHEKFRNYLCKHISDQKDFEIVGVGSDNYQAVILVDRYKPDIVLMDTNLPMGDGMKTAALIKYRSPQTSIIATWDEEEKHIFSVFFNNISGYITREENSNLLCHAIRAVYHGGSLVTPEVILKLKTIAVNLTGFALKPRRELRPAQIVKKKWDVKNHSDNSVGEPPRTISPSEFQIIGYVGKGYTNKEIAETLSLTEGTVRNYVSSVLQKTGLRDRTQMAIYAVKVGLSFSS
jgi:DNA-binding NarL/FixJ family response regulator